MERLNEDVSGLKQINKLQFKSLFSKTLMEQPITFGGKMHKHLALTVFTLLFFISPLVATGQQPLIALEEPLTFYSIDGEPIKIGPGQYHLESFENKSLKVTPIGKIGKPTIIQSKIFSTEKEKYLKGTVFLNTDEDQQEIVLILDNGMGLKAIGTSQLVQGQPRVFSFLSKHTLDIKKIGEGLVTGKGLLTGKGINCGNNCTTRVNKYLNFIFLKATPDFGYRFGQWTNCETMPRRPPNSCGLRVTSNVLVTAEFTGPFLHQLNIEKNGSGLITGEGVGVNCGENCTSQVPERTPVTLVATPLSGSVFVGWEGCDTEEGQRCKVEMTAPRTVKAKFTAAPTYTLRVEINGSGTVIGEGISCWTYCQETFQDGKQISLQAHPANGWVFSNWQNCPFKNGTQCSFIMHNNITITANFVDASTPGTLRIENRTHYDMIDIVLGNEQQVAYPNGILVGNSFDFPNRSPGTESFYLGVGFYNSDGSKDVWFTLSGTFNITPGNITVLTFNNPTIGDLLTLFSPQKDWRGIYFDDNLKDHVAMFRFSRDGRWDFFDDGTNRGNGQLILVNWPNYSPIVTFKICTTCEDIHIANPWATFQYRNGPSSFPIIEYIRQ